MGKTISKKDKIRRQEYDDYIRVLVDFVNDYCNVTKLHEVQDPAIQIDIYMLSVSTVAEDARKALEELRKYN